jgi:hypothetical protein
MKQATDPRWMIMFSRVFRAYIGSVSVNIFLLATILFSLSSACAAPPITLTTVPTEERVLDPQQTGEEFTVQKWQRIVGKQQQGLASQVITWEFFEDGTFRWHVAADYDESYVGAWAISAASENSGIIFLASAASNENRAAQHDVLSFEFQDGRLELGEAVYEGIPFIESDVPPSVGDEAREAVRVEQRDRFFSLWAAITRTNWQSGSAPPGDPNQYRFNPDGTYSASFAATQCDYTGTWSLISSEENTGQIRLSIPANSCDPRGPQDAFVREIPITLRDMELLLYETIYVPAPEEVQEGP